MQIITIIIFPGNMAAERGWLGCQRWMRRRHRVPMAVEEGEGGREEGWFGAVVMREGGGLS